ncbi:MAG: hypothetical protein ACRDOM_04400 [Nocardioides sp.]
MARRVYLHVGVPKTGTTFLQTAMWHNRRQLRQQDFLYPGTSRMDHYHASRVVREASPAALGEHADAWDRLVDELAAWKGDGLISHEFFSMATRAQALRAVAALAPAEVTVVLTARDYGRQFPAVWQEALKMNSDASLDEFMKQVLAHEQPGAWGWRSQDVPAVLQRWSGAVSTERVHVITVPPSDAPRDLLWRRWCQVLGIDDSTFNMDLTFGNESLGAVQAALMHRLKPHLSGPLESGPVRHRWVRQYFGHEVLVPQRGERFGLRADDAAEVRRLSIAMTEAISQAGYPVTGELADLVPAETQPPLPHPDDVTEAEMLDAAVRAIEQMIRDVRELSTAKRVWRRKAQRQARQRLSVLARHLARRVMRGRR